MKRAIRYLRYSQLGQSNGSIERQELYTDQWIKITARENSSALETLIEFVPAYRIGILDQNREICIVRNLFPGI